MNKLVNMFLVSDVVNFSDLIIQEIESVKNKSKRTSVFCGNVCELAITRQTCTLSNLLDSKMAVETIETHKLHQLIKQAIRKINK